MTDKQIRFCEEYVIDLNATQAAIRSGYSVDTARSIASENLSKPNIQEYITKLQEEISQRNRITVDECVSLLASMARFDIADIFDKNGSIKSIHEIPKETRLALESLESYEENVEGSVVGVNKKVKISNRRANIVELMKYLGGYEKDNDQKTPKLSAFNLDNATPEQIEALAAITGIKSKD